MSSTAVLLFESQIHLACLLVSFSLMNLESGKEALDQDRKETAKMEWQVILHIISQTAQGS